MIQDLSFYHRCTINQFGCVFLMLGANGPAVDAGVRRVGTDFGLDKVTKQFYIYLTKTHETRI